MDTLINQVQIVAFYRDENGKKGVTLYKSKEMEEVYKFFNAEEIYNRALGFGGVEELFDAIIWSNFAEIAKKDMLKAASKIIPWTTDDNLVNRQKIKNMDNLEWINLAEGKQIGLVPTGSPNIQLFTQSLQEWEVHARELGGATDPLLGKQPPAGTPFRLQERVVFEGKGLHEYRRGKFAKFVEEIYKDWIIPHIIREIMKGKEFLSTLSEDEMITVSETMARNKTNEFIKEKILNGVLITQEEADAQRAELVEEFRRSGSKKFIEILKDEFKNTKVAVKVVISGKQKDLSLLTEKLVNVLRQYLATPQLRQDPIAIKLLNRILEASGISPLEFGDISSIPAPQPIAEAMTKPIQGLAKEGVTVV